MLVFGRGQSELAYFQQCVELLVLEWFGESGGKGLTSSVQRSVEENNIPGTRGVPPIIAQPQIAPHNMLEQPYCLGLDQIVDHNL